MVTLVKQETYFNSTVVDHWWRCMRHDHRLFFCIVNEDIENLSRLPYLKAIRKKLNTNHKSALSALEYPASAKEIRTHLLSAQRFFIACLHALLTDRFAEAKLLHDLVHAELSLLQYIFMENNLKSYI